ncbi:hypothetical protein FJ936_29265 [Mesorhizobium sp. B2-4-13]|uniref:hypothetical protein n=1 Tax=Mesorhizobium sp. B2-4-13 TaxID=2589936 RepID=UPI00114DAE2F|nr:hypothetical protein [Mesorhizobium sp. B2-4-13]TPK79973.1 hypothetical protein FJ936_29265 [Mesorhizobium sp. B2-4-13]
MANDPLSVELIDAMLSRAGVATVLPTASRNEPCRRLHDFMAIPCVGPVTALSFLTRSTISRASAFA